MLRGLMLRDLALLLVNRLKKNTLLVNVPLKWLPTKAFRSKCTKYRLAAGPAGAAYSAPQDPSWI